jgi:type I restriction enzyme M protein
LGYEFSNRRGSEGIHPIQRGKTIDDCTQLYDVNIFDNPEKASTYIYKAFNGDFNAEIPNNLQKNISCVNLVDMLTFDRVDFEKNISLSIKKKVKIESKFCQIKLNDICEITSSKRIYKRDYVNSGISFYRTKEIVELSNNIPIQSELFISEKKYNSIKNDFGIPIIRDILLSAVGTIGISWIVPNNNKFYFKDGNLLWLKNIKENSFYVKIVLDFIFKYGIGLETTGSAYKALTIEKLKELKIPLPPKDIQEKIVSEIEVLEKNEKNAVDKIEELKIDIAKIISNVHKTKKENLGNIATIIAGQSPESKYYNEIENGLPFYQGKLDFTDTYLSSAKVWTTKITKEAIKGDILMSVRAPVGDVNLNPYDKICIGRGLCVIRTSGKLLQHFLWTYLKSIKEEIVQSGNQGATFKAITKSQIETLKIPLPPLSEQKQIVSEIEKIESQIAKLEKSIAEVPQQKEVILKKYLE